MDAPGRLAPIDGYNQYIKRALGSIKTLHGCVDRSASAVTKFFEGKHFKPEQLDQKVTTYQLTPLALAVLKNDPDTVRILREKGASLTVTDYTGNTPAHLAALMGNWPMVALLCEIAKDQSFESMRNCLFGTVNDLRKGMNPSAFKPHDEVAWYKNEKGDIVPMTAAAYQQRTNTTYRDNWLLNSKQLSANWIERRADIELNPALLKLWNEYLTHPPQVYLEEQVLPETKVCIGLGVRANEDIPEGKLLFPYAGEWYDSETGREGSSFRMREVECYSTSNCASRVNDGPPTAAAINFPILGAPCGIALFTLVPHLRHKVIKINYEMHTCKFARYGFIDREEMEEFCRKDGIATSLGKIKVFYLKNDKKVPLALRGEDVLEIAKIVAMPDYILDTPRALIHLAACGLLKAKDLTQLEAIDRMHRTHNAEFPAVQEMILFRKQLITLLISLEKQNPEYRKALLEALDNLFAKHHVFVGMILLEPMLKGCTVEAFQSQRKQFDDRINSIDKIALTLDAFIDLAQGLEDPSQKEVTLERMMSIGTGISRLLSFEQLVSLLLMTQKTSITQTFVNHLTGE